MQKQSKDKNFIDYTIFSKALGSLPSGKTIYVNTINQYSYCIANVNNTFKKALKWSDVLLPDGIGIVAAMRFLSGLVIKKIAGADVHSYLLKKLDKTSGSCFYVGSSEATLLLIKEKLSKEYPNIRVGTYSPPFKKVFSTEENDQIIRSIDQFNPEVLFVGMTAPKQEIWVYNNRKKLHPGIVCTIGAVFDFYAGTIKRPGKLWIYFGLEWFARLVKEPQRMWKRYIYYGLIFIWLIIKEKEKNIFHHGL